MIQAMPIAVEHKATEHVVNEKKIVSFYAIKSEPELNETGLIPSWVFIYFDVDSREVQMLFLRDIMSHAGCLKSKGI